MAKAPTLRLSASAATGAMLLDGFAVPQLARRFIAASQSEVEVVYAWSPTCASPQSA